MSSEAPTAPRVETDSYRAEFTRRERDRAGEPAWLSGWRKTAIARFEESGFPTTRQEQWRFTSVAPIARTRFGPAPAGVSGVTAEELGFLAFGQPLDGPRMVFVDGRHAPELSSPAETEGVRLLSLADALAGEPELLERHLATTAETQAQPFVALNTALFEDAAVLIVPPATVVASPIHLVFFATGRAAPVAIHPRVLIVLGRGSQALVVESYGGRDGVVYFTNAVTDVRLEDGAVLEHYKVQREGAGAYHVATMSIDQGRASRFGSLNVALGAALARTDVRQRFGGEGGECVLNGLFMASGSQHTDTHTLIDHAVPHCASRELYKGVLDGRARGVFHGSILVREQAQKTDAHQVNKNLLLSREALVNSTPAFEIHADDVKCRHGSTTGQLDAAALFYLRSRGLGENEAKALLIHGFASDLVMKIAVPGLRQGLEQYLQEHLPGRLAGLEESVA